MSVVLMVRGETNTVKNKRRNRGVKSIFNETEEEEEERMVHERAEQTSDLNISSFLTTPQGHREFFFI